MTYEEFLERKRIAFVPTGLKDIPELHRSMFPFQRDCVKWALKKGRAAFFWDCGLGKTLAQLEWARHIPGEILILAPLAVSQQTVKEGEKFGIEVSYARKQAKIASRITITNYEMLEHFDPKHFNGIILDESSCIKHHDAKRRDAIITSFSKTPFRLACTATPAPNDYMELGNHAEFLGVMTRAEMLSMFFVHDGGETQTWRLKGHAQNDFWRWICSWAVMMRMPSDLGYEDGAFILPSLNMHEHVTASKALPGCLFPMPALTLNERLSARRESVDDRAEECAKIVNSTPGPWVVWCNLNEESRKAASLIDGAVEVCGSDSIEAKEKAMRGFSSGEIRVIVTKPSIAGFGMNWQHCSNVAFIGLSDSYEQFYQAIRRCWRFGQKKQVNCHIIISEAEGAVMENIKRKERDAQNMSKQMVSNMHEISEVEIKGEQKQRSDYIRETRVDPNGRWTMNLGDCVDVVKDLPDESVGYSVYSPPFASLYTYSDSERDMGNSKNDNEFMDHYKFLLREIFRVTKPGRLMSFHCMNIPILKQNTGYIGIKDFRGELIRACQEAGWIFHAEVCIWKDPVTQMQRTKALGLLHKQVKKDSCLSRQGLPDYLVTMRKPGDNPEPVTHDNDDIPVSLWQKYASPVWMDINPSDTLQFRSARENEDEKHICPLQLQVIERAMLLWSRREDLVLSPFAGIGSEGYIAIKMGRRFVGAELKRSYYEAACANLIEAKKHQATLL